LIQRVTDKTGIEAQIFERGCEAIGVEDCADLIIPVSGAPLEAKEGALKKPILIRSGFQIAARGSNNGNLIWRENSLTEGVFAVALTKRTKTCNSHTSKEAERILSKDWSKLLLFVHALSSWLPRMTMQDFAQRGQRFSSFLMVRTHIVGIAQGAPFS
jgi:hypothetical protein